MPDKLFKLSFKNDKKFTTIIEWQSNQIPKGSIEFTLNDNICDTILHSGVDEYKTIYKDRRDIDAYMRLMYDLTYFFVSMFGIEY